MTIDSHQLPDAEFYGDLFRIAGVNVGIFGFGKSHAARVASAWVRDDQLVTDHLHLRRQGDELLAALDLASTGESDPRPRWHRVDAFARCLREDETASVFSQRRTEITPVDLETFLRASRWNIGFPLSAETLEKRLAERVPIFRSLIEGAVSEFCLVPWMETVEMKGELVRAYFSEVARSARRE